MSNDFIWGLTVRDFQDAFGNSLNDYAVLFSGMAAAAAANLLSRFIIPSENRNSAGGMKHLGCTVIGIGAGALVGFHLAGRLHHVTFAAEKAFKFLALSFVTGVIGLGAGPLGSVIGLITSGGALGFFGRNVLRVGGAFGAVAGSVIVTAGMLFSE
jgi:hypothetical protein